MAKYRVWFETTASTYIDVESDTSDVEEILDKAYQGDEWEVCESLNKDEPLIDKLED